MIHEGDHCLQLCGWPPLHPIWQLIRGCQSRSSESGWTATLGPFSPLASLPPRQRQQQQQQHLRAHTHTHAHLHTHACTHAHAHTHTCTCTTVTTPQKNRDETSTINGKGNIRRGSQAAELGSGEKDGERGEGWGTTDTGGLHHIAAHWAPLLGHWVAH